jgi:hypothetical protein
MAHRQSPSSLLLMITIFVVGALVGLSAAWWIMKRNPVSLPALHSPTVMPAATKQKQWGGQPATTARGINVSELPYDGAPPPLNSPSGKEAAGSTAMPNSSSNSVSPLPPIGPEPSPDVSSTPSSTSSSELGRQPAKSPNAAVVPSEKSIMNPAARTQSAQVKPARDREIERIKRQADDELRRKNQRREPVSVNAAPKAKDMRVLLVQCDRSSNFFSREQCKWRLCSGMWGKNGCPSYAAHGSSY